MTLTPVPYSDRSLPVAVSNPPHDEASLRTLICHTGRLMQQAHYIDGGSGHISARLDAQRILATPAGLAHGFLQPDQLIVIDLDGNRAGPVTDSTRTLRPTPEPWPHRECYPHRRDIS